MFEDLWPNHVIDNSRNDRGVEEVEEEERRRRRKKKKRSEE